MNSYILGRGDCSFGQDLSGAIYKSLPPDIEVINKDVMVRKDTRRSTAASFLDSFLTLNARGLSTEEREQFVTDSKYKVFALKHSVRKQSLRRTRSKLLSCKERKRLKLFDIPKEQQRYELFEPLHDLWLSYIKDVVDFSCDLTGKQIKMAEQNMMKADYHGSVIKVTSSKCPSLVGHEGIVVQETKNTWKIITMEDKIKVIPKSNTEVTTVVEGYAFRLQGNSLTVRTGERTSHKFKKFLVKPV